MIDNTIPFEPPYKVLDNTAENVETFDASNSANRRGKKRKETENMARNDDDNEGEGMPKSADFKRYIEAMDLEETLEFIEILTDRRDSFLDEAKQAAREEMQRRAEELGITIEDLLGIEKPRHSGFVNPPTTRKPRADTGQPKAVKYRDEAGNTWTGLGRKPNWITQFEADGGNLEELKVSD